MQGDVLSGHLVFDSHGAAITAKLVPGAKFLTILRDPVTRFLSAFKYYGIAASVSRRALAASKARASVVRAWAEAAKRGLNSSLSATVNGQVNSSLIHKTDRGATEPLLIQGGSAELSPLPRGNLPAALRMFAARAHEYLALMPDADVRGGRGRQRVPLAHALVRDGMAYDLGFTFAYDARRDDPARPAMIQQELKRLDATLDLVLINECVC